MMNIENLVAALGACTNPNPEVRKAAEDALNQVCPGAAGTNDGMLLPPPPPLVLPRLTPTPCLSALPCPLSGQARAGSGGEPAACGPGGQHRPVGPTSGRHFFQEPGPP